MSSQQQDLCKYCLCNGEEGDNYLVFLANAKPLFILIVFWNGTYGGFFTPNGIEVKIFFPFDDVYPQALMTNYPLQKVNSTEAKIRAAFCYLQCDRMKELLENKSSDDPEYAFFNELYWKYDLYCFNAGCMPSNYGRKNNELAYETMKAILESFKVGIMNRD